MGLPRAAGRNGQHRRLIAREPTISRDGEPARAPFTLTDEASTAAFLARCEVAGLVGLKGHESVGGCRASLYNAQTDAAVDALITVMRAHSAGL